MNETDSRQHALTLRAIALRCQRGLATAHDADLLAQIANALDPADAGPDSPSGDRAALATV